MQTLTTWSQGTKHPCFKLNKQISYSAVIYTELFIGTHRYTVMLFTGTVDTQLHCVQGPLDTQLCCLQEPIHSYPIYGSVWIQSYAIYREL